MVQVVESFSSSETKQKVHTYNQVTYSEEQIEEKHVKNKRIMNVKNIKYEYKTKKRSQNYQKNAKN